MPNNYLIAVPLDEELASFIGKKGSANSIVFYNRKADGDIIVSIAPSSIEEKIYALAETMLIAEKIVISTKRIDKAFGEVLVACSFADKHVIFTDDNDVSQMIKELGIRSFEVVGRDGILSAITRRDEAAAEGGRTRVDIDKSFPVKGVGTVLLGIVTKGSVKVHDTLYDGKGKEISIKSIQMQDENVDIGPTNGRVGLSVKGADYEEVEKGNVLGNSQIKKTKQIEVELISNKFTNEEIRKGSRYGFVSNFAYADVTVEAMGDGTATLRLEKEVQLEPGDHFMLLRSRTPRIFAGGKVKGLNL